MTTDPATAPAAQVPTREDLERSFDDLLRRHHAGYLVSLNLKAAIKALYAPALARLERERDEARAYGVDARLRERTAEDARVSAVDRATKAEAALATAEAEGMRKAAGMLNERAVRAKEQADIERTKDAMMRGDVAVYTLQKASAAILAAIPKEK